MVGAGAVGLCVAEALLSEGCAVTVLERDHAGAGASSGNAGWITPSLSIPVPGPGVIGESLRWLVRPSGPLWIRPTLARDMLSWSAHFLASCSRRSHRRGLAALQAAAARCGGLLRCPGRARRRRAAAPGRRPAVPGVRAGSSSSCCAGWPRSCARPARATTPRRADAAELRELEPSLSDLTIGGVIAARERSVRPEALVAELPLRVAVTARSARTCSRG